jgi:hypothetical protein
MNDFSARLKEAVKLPGFVPFPREVPVEVHAWCRPNEDFVSRKRAKGRLKPEATDLVNMVVAVKLDTDNLAKSF